MEIATDAATYLDAYGVPGVLILVIVWLIRERAKDQQRHDAQRRLLGEKLDAALAQILVIVGNYESKTEQFTAAVNRMADSASRDNSGR